MSSTQNRRVGSITGKLHRALVFRKIRIYIAEDFLISLLLILGSLAQQEYINTGSLVFNRRRFLSLDTDMQTSLERVYYNVASAEDKLLMRVYLLPLLKIVFLIVGVIAAFQLFSILLSWFKESRFIRRTLSPLYDLAVRADELNRMSFGEDKYQRIEDAIDRVQVDETEKLSFEDEDLRGIEAAMNNLLTRMRESNMQQARFVNDASHELRTPIAVIRGYADMLDRWGTQDEKVLEESIDAIRNEADHMSRLVEQLLFLARGDAGKTELQKEETDLNAFMLEIYEESLMIDEDHRYRFLPYKNEDGTGENVLMANIDIVLMKQAVRVLVDNAAKYTEKGDEIVLSTGTAAGSSDDDSAPEHLQGVFSPGEERPYIQVQDTGRGMREADAAHMFERFYRAEDVRSFQGTGLGLSIAKWITDKHGAHFEVLTREGLGTRIRVVL